MSADPAKDASILELVDRLRADLGDDAFDIVDHWTDPNGNAQNDKSFIPIEILQQLYSTILILFVSFTVYDVKIFYL